MMIVGFSSFIADFFHEPELKNILLVVSFLLPLNALTIVPMAQLQKAQVFKKVAIVEIGGLICGVAISIFLAMKGFGVWALVANLMTTTFIKGVLLFVLSGWYPKGIFLMGRLRELWRYSGYLMGTGIANYFITNIDTALIGRLIGTSSLGVYKYAYQLANLPSLLVGSVFERVFFSSYSTFQEDKERIKTIHFKVVRMIAFCTFPMLLVLAMVSDPFVNILLGDQWKGMGHILSFMCVIFMLDSIGGMNNPLFLSQGKTNSLFYLSLILRADLILAMVIGIQFGLDGLLWGLLIAKVINFIPVYMVVGRTVGFTVFDFIRNISRPFLCSISIVVAIYLTQGLWVESSCLLQLSCAIGVAVAVYCIASIMWQKDIFLDVKSILLRRT